jgi:Uma2 family endonuclease
MTAEALLNASGLGRCELLQGELKMMSPSGALHGRYVDVLERWLGSFVAENNLGMTFGAETGFILARNPDTVRAPDIAFVVKERLPDPLPAGFFPGPPDLAVEVLSPGDRDSEIAAKTRCWLAAGCREVWNADPGAKTTTIHRADGTVRQFIQTDSLESPSLLPGFHKPLAELFQQ